MKRLLVVGVAIVVVIGAILVIFKKTPQPPVSITSTPTQLPSSQELTITSPAFADGGEILKEFSCDGANVNPPLTISNVPTGTKSLALIVDDPDAPGGTFTHWLVWNIPPQTLEIAQGKLPDGTVEGINDTGKSGYFGPCPPSGTHRYVFTLYALDKIINLQANAKKSDLLKEIANRVITQTQLTGIYKR